MARSSGRAHESSCLSFLLGSATEATAQGVGERGTQKGSSGRQLLLWGPRLTTACLEELCVLRTAQPRGWGIFLTRSSSLKQFLGYRVPQAPWLHSEKTTFTLCDSTLVDIWGSPLTPHIPPFGDLACSGQAVSSMHTGRDWRASPSFSGGVKSPEGMHSRPWVT